MKDLVRMRLIAQRELSLPRGKPGEIDSICRIVIAGFADGFDIGVEVACLWLKEKEYDEVAEALSVSYSDALKAAKQ